MFTEYLWLHGESFYSAEVRFGRAVTRASAEHGAIFQRWFVAI